MRVLYSFPHKIGADRICYTAWQQVKGLAAAGVDVLAMPAAIVRPVPTKTWPTLARGKLRIPFKLIGKYRAFRLHDYIVARRLEKLAGKIDVVHVWPCGALETIRTAKRLGIPTVLERPNAHTRYAYETVRAECQRIGVALPPGDDYTYRADVLAREETEFREADYLLCPSEFTAKTFRDRGFPPEKILRHAYGFDEASFWPDTTTPRQKFTVLFVGVAAVRKGLHIALDAWMSSPALRDGLFLIAGDIAPDYRRHLEYALKDPSVSALGHRRDVPELMRQADVLVLPSLEEGFGLVCVEAIGSGCVPVVSEACTEICKHMQNALVHPIGDVQTLRQHLTVLYQDRVLLQKLREGCIRQRLDFIWSAAGRKLAAAYQSALSGFGAQAQLSMSIQST
ncbi:MAG: glycosyltransferase family 4 protein [Terriglobia bacterium]